MGKGGVSKRDLPMSPSAEPLSRSCFPLAPPRLRCSTVFWSHWVNSEDAKTRRQRGSRIEDGEWKGAGTRCMSEPSPPAGGELPVEKAYSD